MHENKKRIRLATMRIQGLHFSYKERTMSQTATRMPPSSFTGTSRPQHTEGTVAKTIEQQTAKLPSDLFLWAAGGSVIGSLLLQMGGRQHESLFVGQWAPTFLILGLYNKLVKVAGSDPVHGTQHGNV